MSNKRPFVTKAQLESIVRQYPTPFHLYDEKGIRENARKLKQAFAWNPGFKEYFAVKATPTPAILKILHEEGCGTDCSSLTELMLADRCGFHGSEIMFSANRLEFASNTTKLNVSVALFDRGIWCGNQVADVFQSAHYDGGERHVIRGEYIDLALISEHTAEQAAQAAQTNANIAAIDASGGVGDGKKEVDDAGETG